MALRWHSHEGGCYLDLNTGEVVTDFDGETDGDQIEEGLDAGRLIASEPLPSSVEYGWMAEYAASSKGRLADLLDVALDGSGAFRRFKDVLAGHPAERERWFAFRHDRLLEAMRGWLEDNGVEATNAPPPHRS